MYLVASAVHTSVERMQSDSPDLWRAVRRFNLPVQLAVAAASEMTQHTLDASTAMLVSVAPCQTGSPELFRWGRAMVPASGESRFRDVRMNPTHTLHAIDNLALSTYAMLVQNHAHCLGLGGAAGQYWCALEAVAEHLRTDASAEAILLTGDQTLAGEEATGRGVAMLFSREPRSNVQLGCRVRIVGTGRAAFNPSVDVAANSANGLAEFLSTMALSAARPGWFTYEVPSCDTDGIDAITVTIEIA